MKTMEVLTAAKALIATEATYDGHYKTFGRIIGSIYQDRFGSDTLLRSEATCFCSLGAINAAVGSDAESVTCGIYRDNDTAASAVWTGKGEPWAARVGAKPATDAQRAAFWRARLYLESAIKQLYGFTCVVSLNDQKGNHEKVMLAFDLAIKNAKRRHINGDRQKASRAVSL